MILWYRSPEPRIIRMIPVIAQHHHMPLRNNNGPKVIPNLAGVIIGEVAHRPIPLEDLFIQSATAAKGVDIHVLLVRLIHFAAIHNQNLIHNLNGLTFGGNHSLDKIFSVMTVIFILGWKPENNHLSKTYYDVSAHLQFLLNQRGFQLDCECINLGGSCVSFISALQIATSLIKAKIKHHVLIVGASNNSAFFKNADLNVQMTFFDGVAATLVSGCKFC